MVIKLYTQKILLDIMNKSHETVAGRGDAETRYRIEAGLHKKAELERDVSESVAELPAILGKWLTSEILDGANDVALPEYYEFELEMTERRAAGKGEQLSSLMHSYVVLSSLAKFYSTVAEADLSKLYTGSAEGIAARIGVVMHTKKSTIL